MLHASTRIITTSACIHHVAPGRAETNSNDQNPNVPKQKAFAKADRIFDVWNFEHLIFDIVSDFGFTTAELDFTAKFNINIRTLSH